MTLYLKMAFMASHLLLMLPNVVSYIYPFCFGKVMVVSCVTYWEKWSSKPTPPPPPQAAPKKGKEERKLYTFIAVQSVFSITFLFGCICSCALFTVTFVETYLWVFILWLTTIYRTFFNAGLLKSGACISLFMIVHHLKVLIFQS